jgi:hypothetical protein
MEELRNTYKVLVGTPEGKRLFETPTCTWEAIIEVVLKKWECMDWIHLDQDGEKWRSIKYYRLQTGKLSLNQE